MGGDNEMESTKGKVKHINLLSKRAQHKFNQIPRKKIKEKL